ncbi:hypothetical protein J6590_066147 [Homalodisca vitripennis]|nr:hypothetical protein J6590_066147 [Homalodisca vitripennis]
MRGQRPASSVQRPRRPCNTQIANTRCTLHRCTVLVPLACNNAISMEFGVAQTHQHHHYVLRQATLPNRCGAFVNRIPEAIITPEGTPAFKHFLENTQLCHRVVSILELYNSHKRVVESVFDKERPRLPRVDNDRRGQRARGGEIASIARRNARSSR